MLTETRTAQAITGKRAMTVALAGQPNVGKSTIFNLLTGLSQHVGNWPGKTVEQKVGAYSYHGSEVRVIDLPGTYGLTANSLEEKIARDYIISERPDVVVAVTDASALERNLYLLAELLALASPLVLVLNMMDVAEQQGMRIEPHVLEAALGLPVVAMVAARREGLADLKQAIERVAADWASYAPVRPEIREDHREVLPQLQRLVEPAVPTPYPADWVTLKLLEGDGEITQMMRERLSPDSWEAVHALLRQHEDAILAVVGGRYEWIERMIRAAVVHPRAGYVTLTERIDRFATHPVWGLFVLLGLLAVLFWLIYAVGAPLQTLVDTYLVQAGAEAVRTQLSGAPAWLSQALADGVIGGAGTVLTFLPILIIFFALLALLEDVGYMARAAYVMDRFMHLMGLHGKSFLPLFLGFGCNVPAVMGSRIVDSPRARLLTIMLSPFVPCTARMAVVTVLAPAFFGRGAALVSFGLVGLNLVLLALVGWFVHELVLGGEHVAFIMELPLYHQPNPRTIGISVWHRTLAFLKKAGSIILLVSIVVWALSVLPGGSIESSYLAAAGRLLSPLGRLMGLEWRAMVALMTGFVAKENVLATLGVLFGTSQEQAQVSGAIALSLAPAAGLAFLAVHMLFIPCVATVAVIRQETRSWRWTGLSVALSLIVSLGVGIVLYQTAMLIGWGG